MSSSMKQISQVIKEALSRLKPTIINNDDEHTKARDKKSHANLDEIGKERNIKDEEKSDVEIIYTPTSHWPFQTLPARDPDHDEHQKRRSMPIRILVLDSSFNPPTKAHLALASIALRSLITQSEDRSGDSSGVEDGGPEDNRGHDAHLLLLSVTNADKRLKAGDATYEQRLEMMYLTAKEMEERAAIERSKRSDGESEGSEAGTVMSSSSLGNVAVAAIDEPTFVGKSQKLRETISKRLQSLVDDAPGAISPITDFRLELYFVLGLDTVTRLFDPKFYNDSEDQMRRALDQFFNLAREGGDNSYVICARRTLSKEGGEPPLREEKEGKEQAEEFLSSAMVSPYVRQGKILLFDFENPLLKQVSSTKARNSVRWSYSEPVEEQREAMIETNLTRRIATYIAHAGLYIPDRM
ncbi:hypothetical protein FRB91_006239 [Serendipita sp. 411]|nr:hypothetical protein FRB91_006239 [Serendipita sp. 411]